MVSHKTAKTSFLSTTCKFNHPQVKEASLSNTKRNFKVSESTYIKSWCAHFQHECSINHIWDCHSSSDTSIHHQPKTMTSLFKPTISNTKITFTSTLLTMTLMSGKNGSRLQQNLLNLIHYHCNHGITPIHNIPDTVWKIDWLLLEILLYNERATPKRNLFKGCDCCMNNSWSRKREAYLEWVCLRERSPGKFLMWQRLHELQNWITASLLQTLETSQNEATGLKKALSTVSETGWFTRTELAAWSSSNAFVPADICELAYKLIQHCFLLFLLHSTYKQHATIQYDKNLNPSPFSKKILRQ